MKLPFDKRYLGFGLTLFFVAAAGILFFVFLQNFSVFKSILTTLLDILTPIIYGFAFAYLLNPILRFTENKWFLPLVNKFDNLKRPNRVARTFSVITTIVIVLAIISALIVLIIPQVADSITKIVVNIPTYAQNTEQTVTSFLQSSPELLQYAQSLFKYFNSFADNFVSYAPQIAKFASTMAASVWGFANSLIDIVVGFIISIYVMFSKETFASQAKRVCYALFSKNFCKKLFNAVRITDKTFGGFISGKILDSAIIGAICFIVCAILNIPYAPLVSVLVGVTNIIPFFGPFFGAIPSALIILMESPIQALVFVIFIIILQQLDGNLIGPKILGETTGLSAFWVIFAILIAGGLFGVLGMFIGVPVFAVIYIFIKGAIEQRLRKKNLPTDGNAYINSNELD